MDNKALELGESTVKTNAQIKSSRPLIILVIHRERLSLLFNFDYQIECYTPAAKRVFGYFCLPILCEGIRFIGRVDCKAHRAEQRFEVIKLHLKMIGSIKTAAAIITQMSCKDLLISINTLSLKEYNCHKYTLRHSCAKIDFISCKVLQPKSK